jgi:hypothetical protein
MEEERKENNLNLIDQIIDYPYISSELKVGDSSPRNVE